MTVQVQERFVVFFLNVCLIIIILLASHGTDKKQVKLGISLLLFGKKKIDEMAGRWLVGNKSAISKQNLTIFMVKEKLEDPS